MSKAEKIKEQISDELNFYNNLADSYERKGWEKGAYGFYSRACALELLMNHLEKEGLI